MAGGYTPGMGSGNIKTHYHAYSEQLLVSPSDVNASYNSVSDACNYLAGLVGPTAPAADHWWIIKLAAGTYTEPIITVPSYVAIEGDSIQATIIVPDGDHDVFRMSNATEISFLSIDGTGAITPGSGNSGVLLENVGNYAQLHKISIYNCDKGIDVDVDSVASQVYLEYVDINGTYSMGVDIDTDIDMGDPLNYGVSTGVGSLLANFAQTDIAGNTITVVSHGFHTGDRVTYTRLTGNDITGLTSGEDYYFIRLTADTFQLASSYTDALAGTETVLTAPVPASTFQLDLQTTSYMEDSTQAWVPSSLAGKYLLLRGGISSGQDRLIIDNTATELFLDSPLTQLPVNEGRVSDYRL